MSDSVSKYYENLEDQEYWANKKQSTKKEDKTRFDRVISFISKLFNLKQKQ